MEESGQSDASADQQSNSMPIKRHELLKWNGWGYNDSRFVAHFNPQKNSHFITFSGTRYKIGGDLELPHFAKWVEDTLGLDLTRRVPARPPPHDSELPPPVPNPALAKALQDLGFLHSYDGMDRLFRAHGHTLAEIHALRTRPGPSIFPRIPDVVVWPRNSDEVEVMVSTIEECGAAMVIFGGGTSVTGALLVPASERRTVAALDTSQMSRLLSLDEENLTAVVECGVTGQRLEQLLGDRGYTTGHQPDSYEFSSVGGWVATRASGMKKNAYGNIEDLVVAVDCVTPIGRLNKLNNLAPRISAGPDLNHVVMGSEGMLGVVTTVTLKVRPLPQRRVYGSVVFPHLEAGVAWLRAVASERCQPASLRLMDNSQFKFGHALKPASSLFGLLTEGLKKAYLTRLKGFDVDTMCVATIVFEGSAQAVALQEAQVYGLATTYGGLPAGEANGERGYMLTFVIAYIRDLGMDYDVMSESFETSVPWPGVVPLIAAMKERVYLECNARGVFYRFVSCRVTQTYDAGAVIYVYFAFNYQGVDGDPVHIYEEIENAARDEIMKHGGSISHHHGVGKIRRQFMARTLSPVGLQTLAAIKRHLDPHNTLACSNLLPADPKL